MSTCQLERLAQVFRGSAAFAELLVVQCDGILVVGVQLAAGDHPVGQRHQSPGSLLGAVPVTILTVAHQPADGVGIEWIFRIELAECRKDDRSGARIGVPVPTVEIFLFPVRAGGGKDRLAGKI